MRFLWTNLHPICPLTLIYSHTLTYRHKHTHVFPLFVHIYLTFLNSHMFTHAFSHTCSHICTLTIHTCSSDQPWLSFHEHSPQNVILVQLSSAWILGTFSVIFSTGVSSLHKPLHKIRVPSRNRPFPNKTGHHHFLPPSSLLTSPKHISSHSNPSLI